MPTVDLGTSLPKESELRVRFVDDVTGLEAIREFWVAHQQHPFVMFDFYKEVIRHRAEVVGPLVIVLENDGATVALLVGRIEDMPERIQLGYAGCRGPRVRRFCSVSGGLLGELTETKAEKLVDAVREALREYRLHYAILANLRLDSVLARSVDATLPGWQRDQLGRPNSHWRASLPATYEAFLARGKRKHRQGLVRLGRVLERDFPGRTKIVAFHETGVIEGYCWDAARLSALTYQRQLGAGFLGTEEDRRHCELLAANGTLRAYILYVDNEPRAFWQASVIGDLLALHSTGYDPDFRKYEVGTLLLLRVIEDACAAGLTQIDFGMGAAPYKERFCDQTWNEQHFYVFAPTVAGQMVHGLITANRIVENTGRWLLARAQMVKRAKRVWRRWLSRATTPDRAKPNDQEGEVG